MDTKILANKIRKDVVEMTHYGNSSHVASCLSIADIMAVLYGSLLNVDPSNPMLDNRDRFILSKGHAGAACYAALAETGFFDVEYLKQHYQNGSKLSGHVSHKGVPGVELSTGSLGHGLSVGAGMAYSANLQNHAHNVFVLLSDGECDEGSNWEAFMFAAHHKLSNLIAIIDYNKIQSLDSVENTLGLEPLCDKLKSFRWDVLEVDGHNHLDLHNILEKAKSNTSSPSVILAHTTKGKGVSFMENEVLWHYRSPQGQEFKHAINELTGANE
jgi:transketolase